MSAAPRQEDVLVSSKKHTFVPLETLLIAQRSSSGAASWASGVSCLFELSAGKDRASQGQSGRSPEGSLQV